MKSLANSDFAIVHDLRTNPSHVSHLRPDLRRSFHCRNDHLFPNLRLLKIVYNNAIAPVRASEAKVELFTADIPVEQTKELKIVHVKFQLQRKCMFGEQFLVVGDDPLFGSWNLSDAIPMAWSEDHIWTAETDIVAGKTFQYTIILKEKEGNIIWQPGSDRFIKAWESVSGITVIEDWENAELQKITEKEQQEHSKEEPKLEEKPSQLSSSSSSKSTTGRKNVRKNTNRKNEQSAADRPPWVSPNGKVNSIKNQESKIGDKGLFEDGPDSATPDEEYSSGEEI